MVVAVLMAPFVVPPDFYNSISEMRWASIFAGHLDKVFHFLFYAVVFYRCSNGFAKRSSLKVAILLFAFGIFIEGVQYFIPFRGTSFGDVIANTLGIVFGWGVILMQARSRARRHVDDKACMSPEALR